VALVLVRRAVNLIVVVAVQGRTLRNGEWLMMRVLQSKVGRVLMFVLAFVFAAAPAMADPPVMGAVTFPVDTASVVTVIGVAGGTILLLVFGLAIGFKLIKKLFSRSAAAI
jgi:hypothetical protein